MSVFPRISLRPEVADYLKGVFLNKELLASIGKQEAERHFQTLLSCLSHPPSYTCVRTNVHLASLGEIRLKLGEELKKQTWGCEDEELEIVAHPAVPDVLLIPVVGPRLVQKLSSVVVVGTQCGNAVLRGAHVFAPGVLACPKFMKAGDAVSVFSDVEGKCTRGAFGFHGKTTFVGNGVAEKDRTEIFGAGETARGVGVRMTEPLYWSPSFDGVLPHLAFLQNLPSVVAGHVLGPRPGERVLDMCAAPGGKTCHIATLMKDRGEVVALDKIRNKTELIRKNANILQLRSVKAFCFNSTKVVSEDVSQDTEGPPYPPESFDRVLLDAPCSGLGQRPNMAVRALKRGGVLVYSTCTVTLAENEEQVAWALRTFPELTLLPQEPRVGGEGMPGAGLSPEQLRLLQRFRPELSWEVAADIPLPYRADGDTIGFFIAKFQKN
ncbi:tRNA (cytosine(72)-C(5))-methyltransferase NSUN6 isoform X2 [Corythoichthys intestinalis]|uniref:tRNA (cytosine(72)-C(5))-methyltransferase NSUN6 isoform X2 n=1 Tax=Corythoichthys intestinalis TaxID=161448 RepID=UPI0025A66B43|nr:tRNA (cytosine(72)-C(5))-methyltransferase NSUN6 isoform X2 [Corythoichthys intestinalis]